MRTRRSVNEKGPDVILFKSWFGTVCMKEVQSILLKKCHLSMLCFAVKQDTSFCKMIKSLRSCEREVEAKNLMLPTIDHFIPTIQPRTKKRLFHFFAHNAL